MGRVKLAIKKLEHTNNRQITYSKRRCGILKKARELSILCDIDIFLVMFSPTGKPTICLGERSNLEDVIARFSELTPQERSKRKLESLEALKKTFKKLNHDVNIDDFLGASNQTMEELHNELRRIQSQLSDVQEKLWYYGNEIEQITSIDQARDVEETIQESLARLHLHKEALKNNQLMAFAQAGQQLYPNGICLPSAIEGPHQHHQPISAWLSNHGGQQVLVQEDPSFVLSHRDVNCVADTSLSMPSGYNILDCKQADMEAGSSSQPETFSNDFNTCGLRLQLGGQGPSYHHHYPHNSIPEEKKFKSDMDTGFHGTASVDYGAHGIEPLGAGYDGVPHQWPPSSSHHAVMSLFDKYSFPQQQSMAMIEPTSTAVCHQIIDSSGQLQHSPDPDAHITSECHMGISGLVSLL